jgi:hypothetical protein
MTPDKAEATAEDQESPVVPEADDTSVTLQIDDIVTDVAGGFVAEEDQ